jgi:hypothetical protein
VYTVLSVSRYACERDVVLAQQAARKFVKRMLKIAARAAGGPLFVLS